jgi:hypothetical protein
MLCQQGCLCITVERRNETKTPSPTRHDGTCRARMNQRSAQVGTDTHVWVEKTALGSSGTVRGGWGATACLEIVDGRDEIWLKVGLKGGV